MYCIIIISIAFTHYCYMSFVYICLSFNLIFLFQANAEVVAMESEMNALFESASLFEVSVPEFKQLKACRRDVVMLKTLWDVIVLVQSSFRDWNTTLWRDINVEQMDMDCKKFVKDIRSLDKEMRAWDAFTGKEIIDHVQIVIIKCKC